jgi:hypothetical protein
MMNFADLASAPCDRPLPFTDQLRLAVAAYLARFKGSSRYHPDSDLRCYLSWCSQHRLAGDAQWHHGQIAYPPAWEKEYADPDGSGWLSRNSMAAPKATSSTPANTSNASCPPKQSRRS